MRCLAICNKGFEQVCSEEIKRLVKTETEQKDSCVIFEADEKSLLRLSYLSQSANRILILFSDFDFKDHKDMLAKSKEIKYDKYYFYKKTFAVRCIKQNHEQEDSNVEKDIGEVFFESLDSKVDLDNPDVTVIVYLNGNTAYTGIDFCGIDLSKRSYKIFLSHKSLKGTFAYSLLKHAKYDKDKVLLDPFSNNGIIAIEAALFARNVSPRFYDKDKFKFPIEVDTKIFEDMDKEQQKSKPKIFAFDALLPNIEKIKKNANIAGIEKSLKFSKVDVEWLDTKLDEKSVDIVVSYFPEVSKRTSTNIIEKIYKEFFYQIEFVLKDNGRIFALLHNQEKLIEYAEKGKFKIASKKEVYSGKDKLKIIEMKKDKI